MIFIDFIELISPIRGPQQTTDGGSLSNGNFFLTNLNEDNNILEQSGMSEEAEEIKPDNTETKKAGVKKEHTYTYWVDEKNKSRELPEHHKPQKIDPPPSAAEVYLHCN